MKKIVNQFLLSVSNASLYIPEKYLEFNMIKNHGWISCISCLKRSDVIFISSLVSEGGGGPSQVHSCALQSKLTQQGGGGLWREGGQGLAYFSWMLKWNYHCAPCQSIVWHSDGYIEGKRLNFAHFGFWRVPVQEETKLESEYLAWMCLAYCWTFHCKV